MKATKNIASLDDLSLDDLDIPAKTKIISSEKKPFLSQPNQFSVDVYENSKNFTVVAVIPSIDPTSIKIDITEESIAVSFSISSPKVKGDILASEVEWGDFTRSIIFPSELDVEKVDASIKDGVLIITLPKLVKRSKKTITPKIVK